MPSDSGTDPETLFLTMLAVSILVPHLAREAWENVLHRTNPPNYLVLLPTRQVNPLTVQHQAQKSIKALGSETAGFSSLPL